MTPERKKVGGGIEWRAGREMGGKGEVRQSGRRGRSIQNSSSSLSH